MNLSHTGNRRTHVIVPIHNIQNNVKQFSDVDFIR